MAGLRGWHGSRSQLQRNPTSHAVHAADDAAGGIHSSNLQQGHGLQLAIYLHMGRCAVLGGHQSWCGSTTLHAEGTQDALRDEILPRSAAGGRDHFAGDRVHQVIVGELAAETGDGLQMPQRTDHLGAREIRLGDEHEVTSAQA